MRCGGEGWCTLKGELSSFSVDETRTLAVSIFIKGGGGGEEIFAKTRCCSRQLKWKRLSENNSVFLRFHFSKRKTCQVTRKLGKRKAWPFFSVWDFVHPSPSQRWKSQKAIFNSGRPILSHFSSVFTPDVPWSQIFQSPNLPLRARIEAKRKRRGRRGREKESNYFGHRKEEEEESRIVGFAVTENGEKTVRWLCEGSKCMRTRKFYFEMV